MTLREGLIAAAIVTFLCLLNLPVKAQQSHCGPTGQVEKRIAKEYGESLVGAGIVAGGILFTTTNPDTGSFTVLLRRPDGQTCVLMGGTGYATQEPTKPGVKT